MLPRRRKKIAAPETRRRAGGNLQLPKGKAGVTATNDSIASDWQATMRWLEAEIAAHMPEGSRLPTEAALAAQLGVNRYALRRAIAALVQKGVLRAVPRVGSFVAPSRLKFSVAPEASATQGLARAGLKVANTLVSHRTCTPPAIIARRLGVAQRTSVVELVHRTTANGNSFSQVTTWLPADRFARIGAMVSASGSVSAALSQCGVQQTRCKTVNIVTRPANADEAAWLDLPLTAHVLVVDSLNVDASGEPTHLSQCIVDAARIELAIEL